MYLLHIRLKEELDRLGLKPVAAAKAIGEPDSQGLRDVLGGRKRLSAELLASLAGTGVDVAYVLTNQRQGHGIGESAVHQAVLDAVDLLSLEKKVDADQLARAVVKLAVRSVPVSTVPGDASANSKGMVISGSGNRVAGRDYNEHQGTKGSTDEDQG